MKKIQLSQKDYSKYPNNYQLKLCSEYDVFLPADESVRLLSEVMEELDYTNLYRAYSPKGRKPKTSPPAMFKVLVYGASEGKFASSEVARSCRRDINYMWLLGDQPAPNDDALNRFRSKHLSAAVEDLFYQLAKKLGELDEINMSICLLMAANWKRTQINIRLYGRNQRTNIKHGSTKS